MKMTEDDRRMRETVIEFASCLYGGAWRERLAQVSGMPKRAVSDWFKSDKPLPQALPLSILRAMQNDVEEQIAEKEAICEQIEALRMELTVKPARALPATDARKESFPSAAVISALSTEVKIDTDSDLDIPKRAAPHPLTSARIKGRQALRLVVSRKV